MHEWYGIRQGTDARRTRYYRQAKALRLLDSREKSIDVLVGALKRPNLASDKGLNDTLVDAYGGFGTHAADPR